MSAAFTSSTGTREPASYALGLFVVSEVLPNNSFGKTSVDPSGNIQGMTGTLNSLSDVTVCALVPLALTWRILLDV